MADAISEWQSRGPLFISSVTRIEILALPKLTPMDLEKIKNYLQNFISIPLDDSLAETAALMKRTYNIELPDAVIAAVSAVKRLPLVTRDRQFQKIKEITLIEI